MFGEWRVSCGQPNSYWKVTGPQRIPISGFPSIHAYTLWCRTVKFDVVIHIGRCVYLAVSYTSHHRKAEFLRCPILGVLRYLCLYLLTQIDKIRHCNTYGEERVLGGQPRHSICTNSSHGLSATDEFLVVRSICCRLWTFTGSAVALRCPVIRPHAVDPVVSSLDPSV